MVAHAVACDMLFCSSFPTFFSHCEYGVELLLAAKLGYLAGWHFVALLPLPLILLEDLSLLPPSPC